MSDYSSRGNVLFAGTYAVPAIALCLVAAIYDPAAYQVTPGTLTIFWIGGLILGYAMIAVHELGHVIAARCVGIRTASVTIGHWRRICRFKVRGVSVTIRAAPSGGEMRPEVSMKLYSAPRMAIVLIAGMASESLLVGVALQTGAPETVRSFADFAWAFAYVSVISIGGYHLIVNLLPREFQLGGETTANDGLQLLRLWTKRKERDAERAKLPKLQEIDELIARNQLPQAIEAITSLLPNQSEHPHLRCVLAGLYQQAGDLSKAEAIYRELLQLEAKDIGMLVRALDGLSSLALYFGREDLFTEADAWSTEALRYAPHVITLRGTRGSVLAELRRFDEAIIMLQDVFKRTESDLDKAISAAYLAKSFLAKGEGDIALIWMIKARSIMPEHVVVKRLGDSFES